MSLSEVIEQKHKLSCVHKHNRVYIKISQIYINNLVIYHTLNKWLLGVTDIVGIAITSLPASLSPVNMDKDADSKHFPASRPDVSLLVVAIHEALEVTNLLKIIRQFQELAIQFYRVGRKYSWLNGQLISVHRQSHQIKSIKSIKSDQINNYAGLTRLPLKFCGSRPKISFRSVLKLSHAWSVESGKFQGRSSGSGIMTFTSSKVAALDVVLLRGVCCKALY